MTNLDFGKLSELVQLTVVSPEAVSQIAYARPGMKKLLKNVINVNGVGLQQPVVVKELSAHSYLTGGAYAEGTQDIMKTAEWKLYNFDVPLELPYTQTVQAAEKGGSTLVSFVETYKKAALDAMFKAIWKMFLGVTPLGVTTPFTPFPTIANTSRTYGNIDSTTYTAWNGYRLAATATEYAVTTCSDMVTNAEGLDLFRKVITAVSDGTPEGSTDVVFLGELMWEVMSRYANTLMKMETTNFKKGDTAVWGPNSYNYAGVDFVLDKEIPDALGYMYFVNFDYLTLAFSKGFKFEVTEMKKVDNADLIRGYVLCSCELISTRPGCQGLLTNLPLIWS